MNRAARQGGAAALLAAALAVPLAARGEGGFVPPAQGDKCPVCGMFVFRTPGWVAEAVYADGSHLAFDGAKDLFRHLLGPGKDRPPRSVWVTDYYSMAPVDASRSFFVTGSDILGPMGRELVPFAREEDARDFLKDHGGARVLRFTEVTPGILQGLE